ncbi:hypothetical protein LTS15_007340 [Exophiala xenobiotica]|nr:hypothetical protein LTS15_007340 [Exophiala xenobiotica]
MPAVPRQKACIACADSKRRCDKQLPECQRCLDRDVDCAYPQPKKRRRDRAWRDSQGEELPTLQNHAGADALGSSLDFGDWGELGAADLDIPLSDVIIPYTPTPWETVGSLSTQGVGLESGNIASTPCPWFLQNETWALRHCNEEPACPVDIRLDAFIRTVKEMLQNWVSHGYNSFIHQRLYEKGMPTCLQDAFTMLAAYNGRTSAVTETVLQIAEERSSALVRQNPPTAGGAQGIRAHLARVQALFVYEFIRLFDGSVRVRASAEQQLPTLRRWVIQMWEAVRQYRGEDRSLGHYPSQWTTTEFDREYDTASEMWQLWLLTESVRRSHIIINTITNVYQTMTKGWADCDGAVMFTARRGLWEADSAVKWCGLCCANSPLLVPSLQPGPLISQYAAEEVDDFAKMLWTFLVGTDKIQCWIDRSNKPSRT